MYSVLNTLSEYTYFYISKNILHTLHTSYFKHILHAYTYVYISKNILHTLLLLVFKIVDSLQCILNAEMSNSHIQDFCPVFNPLQPGIVYLYLLKTSENL